MRLLGTPINRTGRLLHGRPVLILYLNKFLNNLPVALPAARRAIRFPIVPFFTAFTSPKILADLYKADLILLILIFLHSFLYLWFYYSKDCSSSCPHFAHSGGNFRLFSLVFYRVKTGNENTRNPLCYKG